MIKGAIGKQSVETKGMAMHRIVGAVGKPKQMKGQMDTFQAGTDSIMKSMSMQKKALKGQC